MLLIALALMLGVNGSVGVVLPAFLVARAVEDARIHGWSIFLPDSVAHLSPRSERQVSDNFDKSYREMRDDDFSMSKSCSTDQ